MILGYRNDNGRLTAVADPLGGLDEVVWIDMIEPTAEEETALEARLGVAVPTREEMEEIEISSRLYVEDDAAFMIAVLPAKADTDEPLLAPVSFVLAGERLITVRYHDPRPFRTFPQWTEKVAQDCSNGTALLVGLLEAIVDRLADVLERAARDSDDISRSVFGTAGGSGRPSPDFPRLLGDIGRKGELTAKVRDSLLSIERVGTFLSHLAAERKPARDVRPRIKTLTRDTRSLTGHAEFLSQKITFLLDATLGMISIQQSNIIKIFSIAAVVFLPPTLVASIYGMNFANMPELSWLYGYPAALVLMAASAALPLWLFKRKGWL